MMTLHCDNCGDDQAVHSCPIGSEYGDSVIIADFCEPCYRHITGREFDRFALRSPAKFAAALGSRVSVPELSPAEAATVARFGLAHAHSIVWTFNQDGVACRAVCEDEDCIHRYECDEPCEVYYSVRRESDGRVTHGGWDDTAATPRHEMHRQDYCNLVEFLNADTSVLPELNEGHETFEIGRTPIEPVWQGEDGALWRRRD